MFLSFFRKTVRRRNEDPTHMPDTSIMKKPSAFVRDAVKEKGMSFIHSPDAAHLLMSEICRSESFLGLEYETDQLAAMQQDCVDYLLPFTNQMVQANALCDNSNA